MSWRASSYPRLQRLPSVLDRKTGGTIDLDGLYRYLCFYICLYENRFTSTLLVVRVTISGRKYDIQTPSGGSVRTERPKIRTRIDA